MDTKWIPIAAVAERLGTHRKFIRRMVAEGELEAIKLGRLVRVSERSVEEFIRRMALKRG